jgi:uncharacterized protein (TIGR02611 family)
MSGKRALRTIVRRALVALAGTLVLVAGLVMLVLPAPGILVIPAGLAILGTEFPWARRLLALFSVLRRRISPTGASEAAERLAHPAIATPPSSRRAEPPRGGIRSLHEASG